MIGAIHNSFSPSGQVLQLRTALREAEGRADALEVRLGEAQSQLDAERKVSEVRQGLAPGKIGCGEMA